MIYKYSILTIDPGIHTGVAYWKTGMKLPETHQFNISNCPRTDALKVCDAMRKIKEIPFTCDKKTSVYIEGVQVWSGSLVSMTSATRGNLSTLAYLVGAYVANFVDKTEHVEILPPSWKGQLNYDALAVWVKKATGEEYKSEHILSAVGMNLKVRGLL